MPQHTVDSFFNPPSMTVAQANATTPKQRVTVKARIDQKEVEVSQHIVDSFFNPPSMTVAQANATTPKTKSDSQSQN